MREWIWLDAQDALAIHDRALVLHGGASGLRDEGLMQSAIARPQQIAAYSDSVDVFKKAAAYTAGIVKNHPFIDGNKRTGFILGVLCLELNGAIFSASETAATEAVLGLASGSLLEADYEAFLKDNSAI